MPSLNQIEKEMDHVFFNIFELNLEDEEYSNEEGLIFMSVLSDIALKHGRYTIYLLPYEYLRSTGFNLPIYLAVKFKSF